MKIQAITYNNHPIMGNLSLSFMDENGEPYDTIIFAGENGSGKTTILKTIASISKKLEPNCKIICRLDESDLLKIQELSGNYNLRENKVELFTGNAGNYTIKYNLAAGGAREEIVWGNGSPVQSHDNNIMSLYFSKLVIKFKTNDKEPTFKDVHSTTELTVDKADDPHSSIYANDLNANELLVNINSQDANEAMNKIRDGINVSAHNVENRILRFRKAFNDFFDNKLRFLEVRDFDVFFEKDGKKFKIDGLSSGEKSIVQYGAFYLKNQNANETFFSLVDEPEQSLHPLWEDKILQYYKDILTKNSQQSSQLFITTHSEYVIRDAHVAKDLIIILKRKEDGTIEATPSSELNLFPSGPTYNEIKYSTFNLLTADFHSELFDFLHRAYLDQGQLTRGSISEFDNLLATDNLCPTTNGITPNLRNDKTLPVYIRNFIDHPSGADSQGQQCRRQYTDNELKQSAEYLISKIRNLPH